MPDRVYSLHPTHADRPGARWVPHSIEELSGGGYGVRAPCGWGDHWLTVTDAGAVEDHALDAGKTPYGWATRAEAEAALVAWEAVEAEVRRRRASLPKPL
jgi:hypothetical protein